MSEQDGETKACPPNGRRACIINLCPNGLVPTKAMSPHVPIAPGELISDVLRCADLGASMVHIHAHDAEGKPSYRKDLYRRIITGIREKRSDLVICASCSGRVHPELDKRREVLDLTGDAKPDMASLTLGSLNFSQSASVNAPETIQRLAAAMQERGIKPELEVFDLGMVNYAKYLIRKGLLSPPFCFNLILGSIAGAQVSLSHAGAMLQELPEQSIAICAGIGDRQLDANMLGVLFADGARVGLEDNLYLDAERWARGARPSRLATNAQLVERIVRCAEIFGRTVADAAEARRRLGLAAP